MGKRVHKASEIAQKVSPFLIPMMFNKFSALGKLPSKNKMKKLPMEQYRRVLQPWVRSNDAYKTTSNRLRRCSDRR